MNRRIGPPGCVSVSSKTSKLLRGFCGAISALLAMCGALTAEDNPTEVEELKLLSDPTIIKRRVWLDYEWDEFKHDARDGEIAFGGMWAWGVSTNQDWAVRWKIPYDWHDAGNISGDQNESALGDIEVATGTAFRLGKTWRTAGGLELHANTGTNEALSDNNWRLKPFWQVAWDATRWLTLGVSAEYSHSIAEEARIPQARYAEFYLPVTFVLPHLWSVSTQYHGKLDFEDDNRWIQKVKVGASKHLSNFPMSLGATIEQALDSGPQYFEFHFVVTWYFK